MQSQSTSYQGDTAWIGCLKGNFKSGLLNASSDFGTEIDSHVQVSFYKENVAAIVLGRQLCKLVCHCFYIVITYTPL